MFLPASVSVAPADTVYLRSGEKVIKWEALSKLEIARERIERVSRADAGGTVPGKDDYRINLSLGVKF
jgi:hypothetical protein